MQSDFLYFFAEYIYDKDTFLHYLKSVKFAGFIRISKKKTPSPEPETGFYDPSICSPF
jgi:hypothetical protein